MNQIMRNYTEWIIRHRLGVVIVILAISIFLGLQLKNVALENTPELWAPDDHPYIKTTRLIEKVFGGRNFTIIGIVPKQGDIFQPAVLTKVKNIQEGIEKIPGAVQPNIISLASKKAKAITGSAEGMEVQQIMGTIPTTPEGIEKLKADIARNPIFQKAVISPDNKAVAIIADFKISKENATYSPLYNTIEEILKKERDAQVDIYLGGLPVHLRWMEYYIMQMPFYFLVSLLIIIVIQYCSFRSLQGMFLPTVTALLSVVWAIGFMVLKGYRVDAMNMNTPILIMAVTAGHAIQILKRYYEEYRRILDKRTDLYNERQINNAAIVESMVIVGPIMIMAGIISITVFYSLKISNISMIRRFGELAASGILAGLILELTLIPTLRSFLPVPKIQAINREGHTSPLDRMLTSLSCSLIGKKALIIFAATLGIIVSIFLGTATLREDNSLKRYYALETQLRKDDTALNELFGGTNSIIFLVEGKERDSLKKPDVLRGMVALQAFLDDEPFVGKTQSLADLIRRMNRAMHEDNQEYDTIPDSSNLIAQYLLLYSMSGEPQDFNNYVDNDYQKGAIWVFMKTDSTSYAAELYAKAQVVIEKNFPSDVSVRIGGSLPQVIAINKVIIQEKLHNILQMAVILFLLSSLVLRSFVGGLFVLTPLIAVVMANFGFMGWLGIPLDIGTALTASLAVAIGADYELYLMFRLKEELARTQNLLNALQASYLTAGKAIILASLSIAGGYSTLLVSEFAFYRRFSAVVIVTMMVSALATIVLLRSMMMIFKPRFVFGEQRKELFDFFKQVQKEKNHA